MSKELQQLTAWKKSFVKDSKSFVENVRIKSLVMMSNLLVWYLGHVLVINEISCIVINKININGINNNNSVTNIEKYASLIIH